jgi:hypothetical protein
VRVELVAILSKVEFHVDKIGVENLFLVFKEGKEIEQTAVASDMGLVLSRALAMHQTRNHQGHSRRETFRE